MTSASDWRGRVGREWADKVEALDRLLGPVGDAGIAAFGDISGARVLDIGCGGGATSLALAAKGAQVTGVDVSMDLLEVARRRGGAEYLLADAGVADLGDPYDALYSRCGTMFFDQPAQALAHIAGHLKPSGRVSFVCWQAFSDNDWAAVPLRAAEYEWRSDGGAGPFAWADPAVFRPLLQNAGLEIEAIPVSRDAPIGVGDDPDPVARAVAFCLRIGPLASRLRGAEAGEKTRVKAALYEGLQDYLRDGEVVVNTKAWVITGGLR